MRDCDGGNPKLRAAQTVARRGDAISLETVVAGTALLITRPKLPRGQ